MKLTSIGAIGILALAGGCDITAESGDDSPLHAPKQGTFAFLDANVIPMDSERIIPNQSVIVDDGKIVSVGPSSSVAVPGGATVINADGLYLMPGLVDAHVHLWDTSDLLLFVANGITTIRDLNGTPTELEWRDQIEDGDLLGPRMFVSSPIIDGSPPFWSGTVSVETAAEARSIVNEQKRLGYDFIKVYSLLQKEAYDGIIAAARSVGLPVVGHLPGPIDMHHALEAGQYSFEHLYGYTKHAYTSLSESQPSGPLLHIYGSVDLDQRELDFLARLTKEAGTWNCPTLIAMDRMVHEDDAFRLLQSPEMRYVSAAQRASWDPNSNFIKTRGYLDGVSVEDLQKGMVTRRQIVKALNDAGAGLVLGSDTGTLYVQAGFSIHVELANLTEAGLTPFEALRAGTSNGGKFLQPLEPFGTVEVGRRADLLLLRENPLEDVANVRQRVGVMVDGRWLPEESIQERLAQLSALVVN